MNLIKIGLCALALLCAVSASAELRVLEKGPKRLRLLYEPNGPALERGRGVLVALPPDGDIRLEIIEARVARKDRADEKIEPVAGPAFLGRQGMVRHQRVAELAFAPHVAQDGVRTLYDRVVVDVHISGGAGHVVADPWGEDFYRQVLINSQQARTWRVPPKRRAARKTALQEGTWLQVFVTE